MHDHARGHANGHADQQHVAPATQAPGRTTQHEQHAQAGGKRAKGSVFDAYRKPANDAANDADHKDDKNASLKHIFGGDDAVPSKDHADKHNDDHDADDHDGGDHDSGDKDNDETAEASSSSADRKGARPKKVKNESGGGEIHIITRAGLRHLREGGREGRAAAKLLYNNPNAYIVLKPGQRLPHGWKAKATLLYPSFTDFDAAVKAGRVGHGIDAVVLDNEHWDQTPHYEKTNAAHYAKLFGELAHSLGLKFIAAPTRKWFAADAKYADIIDVQLQSRESHTQSYLNTLKHDAKLAHRLNPDIKVVAQISSNRNHLDPDHSGNLGDGIDKAEHDIIASSDYVDGFWGYLYQQNKPSIKAGRTILEDLAEKRRKGVKV